MTWEALGSWWLDELATDPAYESEIGPMLIELLAPKPGGLYVDLGCGDGRLMTTVSELKASVVGCDLNSQLLAIARRKGPVVKTKLPELGWLRRSCLDGAFVGLVLEHLEDEAAFFLEVAQAVKSGGVLAIVINHPIWTAPRSSPIEDPGGEVLWRPGLYFGRGYSDEPAGRRKVRFHHRTAADLLNNAAKSGWDLQRIEERGISTAQLARFPEYAGQEQIPRILGARWSRR